MWFKNLQLYRLASPFPLALAQLEEQLGRVVFTRCGSQDKEHFRCTHSRQARSMQCPFLFP